MSRCRGSREVVRALVDERAPFTFGIPGTHNIELYDELERTEGIRPILVTDERGGAFMADAVSRTSDSIGVLNLVPGAGVTHSLSGIAEAYLDSVPLVVIACGIRRDTGAAYQLHDVDQLALLGPVTKAAWRVERPEQLYASVRKAFQEARRGRPGPVAVEIPAELLMLTHDFEPEAAPAPPAPAAPDHGLVKRAHELLERASSPALYLGAGAAAAGEKALVALAEALGAPVTTTIQGKGVFPESHPLWLWNGFGEQAPRFVRRVMEGCDVLLAIGCRFAEVATASYGLRPPESLIHVDADREVFDRNFRSSLAIEADSRLFCESLLALGLGERRREGPVQQIAEGRRKIAESRSRETSDDGVTPDVLFRTLQRQCGEDAIYATDSGNGTFLAMEHLRLDAAGRFIAPVDFSCMGYSVPAAIGAKFANPHRDVVAIPGDGAFLMTGLEMLTATAYSATPLVCVLADRQLGQIAAFQKIPLARETCTRLPPYDLRAHAATTGAAYHLLERDADAERVLSCALAETREGRPALVEVLIDASRPTYFTSGVLKTNFWRLPLADRARMLVRALARRLPGG
jgi:acetolactate synthase-1/2/3 large subunit